MLRIKHATTITLIALCCAATALALPVNPDPQPMPQKPPAPITKELLQHQFRQANPGVYLHSWDEATRIWGNVFGTGATVEQAAESFRINHAAMLGVLSEDLKPYAEHLGGGNTIGLMHDDETGQPKFTLVYYTHERDGVPVWGSMLRLLVTNTQPHTLVWANPDLRELGDFRVPMKLRNRSGQPAVQRQVLDGVGGGEVHRSRDVIWAGTHEAPVPPVLAQEFIIKDGGDEWRIIRDATTGEVLMREFLICFGTISGNVSGLVTNNYGSEQCEPEVSKPLPFIRVTSGAATTFTDANGNFVIAPQAGTVASDYFGQWFRIFNQAGALQTVSGAATTPANLLYNSANTDELVRAQANAYREANVVRSAVIAANPTYPESSIAQFPCTVNRTDNFCPGNAWYSPVERSINFCRAGSGYPNTAWSSVVHHEYGHHIVEAGGSGQGAYGEGFGDTMSTLILDTNWLGWGFFGDCGSSLRNADNTMQYPCSGAIHTCGQLLSGCWWSTRNYMVVTEPANYQTILLKLAVNSVLMHSGSSIAPSITVDVLTLDDDNGNLGDGTPHSFEIESGFGEHNMTPQPAPTNDICSNAIEVCSGTPVVGSTSAATNDGSANCGTSGTSSDVWYKYTPNANGSLTASLCTGTSYDSVLSIHSGCPGNGANQLGCDDDGCGTVGGSSRVTLNVTANQTYYIRIAGWQGATGGFTLTLTGPSCTPNPLVVTLPDGSPSHLAPGVPNTMTVRIQNAAESYVPGTGVLRYRYSGGTYQTAALAPLGGNLYQATFPPTDCNSTPEFYVSAQGNGGSTVHFPVGGSSTPLSADMGVVMMRFHDNFQTNMGWTASFSGATSGFWQRGVPVNDNNWAYDPSSDGDGSGQCYLTENALGNTDVDNGSVTLTSPVIDMTGMSSNMYIAYEYFNRLTDASTDRLLVQASSNGDAGPWVQIANHNVDRGLVWTHHEITRANLQTAGVALTSNMKVRFTANDSNPQSIVECGVDGFKVVDIECVNPAPTGACCFSNGSCADTQTESDCTNGGGTWQGSSSLCSGVSCQQPCAEDVVPPGGDGQVTIADINAVLAAFGACSGCPEDIVPPGGDGHVTIADVNAVLAAFGPCQ